MYRVFTFPRVSGTPRKFKRLWVASWYAWVKSCVTMREVRVVDSEGKHLEVY